MLTWRKRHWGDPLPTGRFRRPVGRDNCGPMWLTMAGRWAASDKSRGHLRAPEKEDVSMTWKSFDLAGNPRRVLNHVLVFTIAAEWVQICGGREKTSIRLARPWPSQKRTPRTMPG